MSRRPVPQFGTKAETLQRLAPMLSRSSVPASCAFEVERWRGHADALLGELRDRFSPGEVAVRSSSTLEDGAGASMAGAFDSVLGVPADDREALRAAVGRVIRSMGSEPGNQVLVQRMVAGVVMAGVVMTRDLHSGAPYYVVNYDDESGRTDTVTGGQSTNKTVYVLRGHVDRVRSPRLGAVLAAVAEIESVFGGIPLDIEFALDDAGQVATLQVRRMTALPGVATVSPNAIVGALESVRSDLTARFGASAPGLAGQRAMLGLMPDWNPAELLGLTPRPLAMGLFRELITRDSWRVARAQMGYRHPPDCDLMVDVLGHPYVDVRASFNSLLPASLGESTAQALVDAWIGRLGDNPHLHDKVEFEVAQTCTDFSDSAERLDREGDALDPTRRQWFRESLRRLTIDAIAGGSGGSLASALEILCTLERRQLERALPSAGLEASAGAAAQRARELISEARAQAAVPFAVCARHAFIGEALLRSAVRRGAIAAERLMAFHRSLQTVATAYHRALASVTAGDDETRFLARYGHLRPGTFEIGSPRYVDRWSQLREGGAIEAENRLPLRAAATRDFGNRGTAARGRLDAIDAPRLIEYARKAAVAREYGKFVLSRNVSDILEWLAVLGRAAGLERAEVAMLRLEAILEAGSTADSTRLRGEAEDAGRRHALAQALRFPPLIVDPDDVYVAPVFRCLPNLYGRGVVRGNVLAVRADDDWSASLRERIVCIESADPGFDWIFGAGVKALITQFGGANSHMAIRCMELGVPAAIGCGEQLYSRILDAGGVELNFDERVVRPRHAH
ncbi:MAG: PEP/pyruvate-binding domain-containing protein [Burkholderiaceae bacterium]